MNELTNGTKLRFAEAMRIKGWVEVNRKNGFKKAHMLWGEVMDVYAPDLGFVSDRVVQELVFKWFENFHRVAVAVDFNDRSIDLSGAFRAPVVELIPTYVKRYGSMLKGMTELAIQYNKHAHAALNLNSQVMLV